MNSGKWNSAAPRSGKCIKKNYDSFSNSSSVCLAPDKSKSVNHLYFILNCLQNENDYESALAHILFLIKELVIKRDPALSSLHKNQMLEIIKDIQASHLSDKYIQKLCLQIFLVLLEKKKDQNKVLQIYRLIVNAMQEHITDETTQIDGLILLEILLQIKNGDGRLFIMEVQQKEMLEITLVTLSTISGSMKMKIVALKLLRQLIQINPSLLDLLDDMIHILPGFIDQDGWNQELMETVLPFYLQISKIEKYKKTILVNNLHKVFYGFAVKCINCETMLDYILNIFVNLNDQEVILFLIENDFIETTLFTAMNTFFENISISIAGLKLLKMAASLSFQNFKLFQKWIAMLYHSCLSHFTSADMQIAMHEAATAVLKSNPKFVLQIGENIEENQYPLQSICLGSFFQHRGNVNVFVSICETIYWMASSSVHLSDQMMQKNIFVEILGTMLHHKTNAAVVVSGCRAIKCLCIFSPPERKISVCKYGKLMELFVELFAYKDNPAILMEAICFFTCLADADILEIPSFMWKAVTDAMTHHSDYVLVQESILEILAVIIHKERTNRYQLDNEIPSQILKIMNKFPENLCIQRKGLCLLQLLTHVIPDRFKIDQVAQIIVDLMNKHPFTASIQVECCILIILLEKVQHSKTELFIRYDCQNPVFAIFRNYSNFSEILDIAYQCLFVLSHGNKKSVMLLKACAAGNLIEAECLVHLNADVNYKENGYTPLLCACENGHEQIITCLLTKEISDFLTPLKVAYAKNYNRIVGLLLQHIGQEPQTQSIFWNNLGLGNLNQHWLFPTFVNDASAYNPLRGIGKKLAHEIRAFCKKYFDPNESFLSYSSSISNRSNSGSSSSSSSSDSDSLESSFMDILAEIELKEWQQTTLTGAVIPFHIHDPRRNRGNWQTMDVHCRGQSNRSSLFDMEKLWLRKKCFLSLNSPPETGTLPIEDGAITIVEDQETDQENLQFPTSIFSPMLTKSLNPNETLTNDESLPTESLISASFRKNENAEMKASLSTSLHRTNSCSFPVRLDRNDSNEDHSKDKIQCFDFSNNNCASLIGLIDLKLKHPQSFASLKELIISNNKLTFLPEDSFDLLPALENLDLSSNQFQEFPSASLRCPHLKTLKLKYNQLQDTMEINLPISFSLKKLDLSGNHFKVFPGWISEFMPGLEKLYLKSSKMESIKDEPLQLKRLLKIDLSDNSIRAIPDKFFVGCNNLMILKAFDNHLVQLPSEEIIPELLQLQELYLSDNMLTEKGPLFLPKFILRLPRLTVLDMRNNKLTGICSPSMWNTTDLKKLLLGHNQIIYLNLSKEAEKWRNLELLDISFNKLKKIPREIGYLTSLRSLDFSFNPEIRNLPDDLGYCEKLWEMPLNGLEISLNIRLLKGRVCDLILYLNHKLKKAQSYYRMKMMVVGYGGHGKTTLLRSLMQEKGPTATTATVGIHVKDWKFYHKRKGQCVEYTISTWDFAGQEEFYSTHQCFLSNQAIYLVVYDARCNNIEILKCWLANIHAQAPDCPVLVVATHKDLIPEDEDTLQKLKDEIKAFQIRPDFPIINDVIIVDSRSENNGISHLRKVIKQLIDNYKVRGQHVMGQKIPASYIKLAKIISREASCMKNEYPVLTRQEMMALLKKNQLNMTTIEFNQAIRFLDETGELRHFDVASNQLNDLYFIDPGWLCRMLAQVVTVEQINPYINKFGIMQKKDLNFLFTGKHADIQQNYIFPPGKIPQFLKLLEKFEIALPQNEKELLIPCRLPISHPDLPKPNCNSIKRIYQMFFMPIGLWSRLITRIIAFSKKKTILSMSNPKTLDCYRYGIFAYWTDEKYFYLQQQHKKGDEIVIEVPNTKEGCRLMGEVVDHLDSLIEERYPGLLIADAFGICPLEKLTPCPGCKEDERHFFNLDDLIQESDSSPQINCPLHKGMVPLALMAPDIMLSDIAEDYMLQQNQLYLQQSPRNLLGRGQFGKVYQATYKNQSVAVKLFTSIGDYHPHKMLRKEATVLIRLKHPNIVSLLAVGLQPHLLVMEKAPYGSLRHVLDNRQNMNQLLIHRIALQIAEGLMYLHQQMIIYRDLKPANILVFSLSLTSLVNIKISDYGISQLIAPYGLTAKEGTPGYQAPEVIRRENYSFQSLGFGLPEDLYLVKHYVDRISGILKVTFLADLFSYGITLYILLSGGKHPFDHLKNPYELEKTISYEQSIYLASCKNGSTWPDMFDLLHQCLDYTPERRPTAEQVCKQLKNAETISLKQMILVTKFYSIDCMTVTENSNGNSTLWVTSGNNKNVQLSWLKPNDKTVDVGGQILDIHRPLSLLSVGNIIFLGCISGRIEVYYAEEKQHLHSSRQLSDAILSIFCFDRSNDSALIIAGSADGNIAVFLLECLIRVEECEPICIQRIQFHEPVKCMGRYGDVIFASCGDSVFKLTLQMNAANLHRNFSPSFDVVKMKMNHSLLMTEEEIPNINTMAFLGKMMYITRDKNTKIEIWDVVKEKYKNHTDIFNLLSEYSRNQARITATLLDQINKVLWVGTGSGHLVILECHTLKPLRLISRHPNPIRSLLMYSSPESDTSREVPVVVCGTYEMRFQQDLPDTEVYGCISVWDSNIVEYIQHFEEEKMKKI